MLTQSLIAAVFLLWSARATPTGNHTCTGVVKHEVTVRVNVTEPVTFRAYEWCLRVPPRCSTYTIQLKDRVKIHREMHNRTITVCCKGYVEIDYKCVPACPPETECPNMHCNRTNHCYCTPGYTGLYCNHPCPKGVWGAGCIKPCDCPTGYTCHYLTGDCMIDDSPPAKTRRTTTAEYLTEAATTLDTTQPTTRTPTTIQTTRPTTTPTTTTTTTMPTTTTTTTTSTTTTERPTTTTSTTTTTERPTTTELVTQPPSPTQPPTTTEQTTTTTTTTTTTEQPTAPPTSTPVPTVRQAFEDMSIPTTSTTTEALTTHKEIQKQTQTFTLPPVHIAEATEGTTTTSTTTSTQKTTIEITSTTTTPPHPTTIALITVPPTTLEEKTTEPATTTTTTTTTTTPAPTSEQTTRTTPIEPTTEPTPNTTPTTSTTTTQATVQTTLTTTQIPTTTTTETVPAIVQKEIQTEPTIFTVPPIKFDMAAVTAQAPVSTGGTIQTTHLPTTVAQTTTTTEPTTQTTTATTTTTTTTERQTQTEPITSTTLKIALQTELPPHEEVFKTATPQLEKKNLDIWGTKTFGIETKTDEKELLQSVVKIGTTEQQLITTPKPELESDRNGREQIFENTRVHSEDKLLENAAELLTSTTDRLDRMIIEDVPKPVPPKPTADDSPIKLVEEVISKYFPDTFLKPNKARNSETDKVPGKGELELPGKSDVKPWIAEAKEKVTIKAKTAETSEALGTEEETKSHPRNDITTTTIPPPTTPDISTLPIITPKVIVSAKNPDEIDLGGVIYRKMKFFPPAKPPEEPIVQATPPPTASYINLHTPTVREPTTPTGDRFKIYLPEYEKSTEKVDSETTESPAIRTFLPKFNFDKEDFDYGKQSQPKKAKQKDKEVKKYKIKPNEATIPPTSADEMDNERVTNNVFLQTKEFKVHLATTKAAKFGDGYYTKSDQESTEFVKFQKKKPKYGSAEYEPTKFVKFTVLPESQDFEEGTREGDFPTTNAKPPHTWYSHAREKAKIKNAFKIMKSTVGLDLNAKPTEESLEESNDIHSSATQFTEREPRSAAVTYQEDLNNPQMFGQVKFNAPEGFLSSVAEEGVKSGIYASVAVGGGCFVAMATLVAVLWLRLKGRSRPRESSVSFEDGDVRNPARIGQPGQASSGIGDYETVYPIAGESDEMEVVTFFCPTFTNNYAERINREFKEMSYDHPRPSVAEPLYAEILHPKIKDLGDELEE